MTKPPTIDHRPKPPIDKVIGVIGAVVFVILLGWLLRKVDANYGLGALAAVVIPFIAICLILAAWLDRRASARKEAQRDD